MHKYNDLKLCKYKPNRMRTRDCNDGKKFNQTENTQFCVSDAIVYFVYFIKTILKTLLNCISVTLITRTTLDINVCKHKTVVCTAMH